VADVIAFDAGGFRYISAVFQYSGGVAAEPGFAIERARLLTPLPLLEGFAAVEAHLAALGRPTTAFAACELRSPAPFSEQGFVDFNRQYVQTLERWGLYRDGVNPVARTNVCPEYGAPAVPSLHAFSYTVPAHAGARDGFIVAGSGEAQEGGGTYAGSVCSASGGAMRARRRSTRCTTSGPSWVRNWPPAASHPTTSRGTSRGRRSSASSSRWTCAGRRGRSCSTGSDQKVPGTYSPKRHGAARIRADAVRLGGRPDRAHREGSMAIAFVHQYLREAAARGESV
jgi:hypothetical protein